MRRYLYALLAVLAFCALASASTPADRARAALALAAAAPQATAAPYGCDCANKKRCLCDGIQCDCFNCCCRDCPGFKKRTQEDQWRADGWQRDAAGQWFRVLGRVQTAPVPTYQPAPAAFAPALYAPAFGGFGGGVRCGPAG